MTVSPSSSSDSEKTQVTESDTQSLERIKQILLGDRLAHIMTQIQEMDAQLSQRLSSLEHRVDEQFQDLNQRLTEELQSFKQKLSSALDEKERQYQQLELSFQDLAVRGSCLPGNC